MHPFGSLRSLIGSPTSMRRRAAKAGAWNLLSIGLGHSLRLFSNLIMSRLLLPDAFGTIALVATLLAAVELLTDIGISQSVIRSPRGEEPHFLRAAWTIQLVRRSLFLALGMILIGALVLVLAPFFAPIGTVYADPNLPYLIMASSIFMVLRGLGSTNAWVAERRMEYRRLVLLGLVSQIVSIVTMLSLSLVHASAWTLLAGMLAGTATGTLLSHIVLSGPRMAIVHDKQAREELWRFGKWIMASSTLTFVSTNIDKLILGALLGSAMFGNYIIAITWIGAITGVISRLADGVVFPALSEVVRERPEATGRAITKMSAPIDALSIAGFLGALLVLPHVIELLYTREYHPAAQMVPLVAIGILNSHFSPIAKLLLAQGESRALAVYSGLNAALICVGLPAAYYLLGLPGALLAMALSPALASLWLVLRASTRSNTAVAPHLLWFVAILGLGMFLAWNTGL